MEKKEKMEMEREGVTDGLRKSQSHNVDSQKEEDGEDGRLKIVRVAASSGRKMLQESMYQIHQTPACISNGMGNWRLEATVD
eukprot:755767-Hanusia_phi.AAC.1